MKIVFPLAILLMSPSAAADGWLAVEAPAAVAVSDAQAGVFRPGVMPAVGAYTDNGWFALGVRLRAGVLRDGAAPGDHRADPKLGGLMTASFAARVHRFGAWVEGALGGGLTGSDLVPAAEVGAGWGFEVGDGLELGPSIRFARAISRSAMDTLGSADLVLVGIDLRFGREHPPLPRTRRAHATPIHTAPEVIAIERDRDAIVERLPGCAEVADGCTFGEITIVDDRIILPEHVLFDLDRARVRSQGRELLGVISLLWRDNPAWLSITIEGHADVRGSDAWNLELSQLRAERVRDVLVEHGHDGTHIHAIGHGRTRPRDPGTTEACHQRNRRVELVIERRREVFR